MARCTIGGRREIGIAEAAIPALFQHDPLTNLDQIGNQRFAILIENLRTLRHFQHHILAPRTGAVLPHAVHAGSRLEVLLVAVIDQRVEAVDTFDPHIAAASAVPAVRAAELDEFFAPERDATCAAIAGPDEHFSLIKEFHEVLSTAFYQKRESVLLGRSLDR